jgi:hypothetical protein
VNAALVAELDPDVVVAAVGARRVRPAIPGADAAHVLDPWQLRGGFEAALARGPRVAVVGGGLVGVEIAERLCRARRDVRSSRADRARARDGAAAALARRPSLKEHGVARHTGRAARRDRARPAPLPRPTAPSSSWRATPSCCRTPPRRTTSSRPRSRRTAPRCTAIGDCVAPRTFEEAIYEATRRAIAI